MLRVLQNPTNGHRLVEGELHGSLLKPFKVGGLLVVHDQEDSRSVGSDVSEAHQVWPALIRDDGRALVATTPQVHAIQHRPAPLGRSRWS